MLSFGAQRISSAWMDGQRRDVRPPGGAPYPAAREGFAAGGAAGSMAIAAHGWSAPAAGGRAHAGFVGRVWRWPV